MVKHNSRAEVLLLIPAFALTACGTGASGAALPAASPVGAATTTQISHPITTAVPWINEPAAMPTTTTSPKPVPPPCTPEVLTVGSVISQGAMGSAVQAVPVANIGRRSCSIPDDPTTVTALGANGSRDYLTVKPLEQIGTTSIPSGTSVTFMMQTSDFCDASGTLRPTNHYSSVEIDLTTGVLVLKNVQLLLCANQIFAGFQPSRARSVPSQGSVASLSPRLQLPETIKAGSTLSYVVTLGNQTNTDVSLAPCPVYREEIFVPSDSPQKISRTLQLNCSSIHSIRPHSQASFEMVIPVPSQTAPAKFSWQIGPIGPYIGVRIDITSS